MRRPAGRAAAAVVVLGTGWLLGPVGLAARLGPPAPDVLVGGVLQQPLRRPLEGPRFFGTYCLPKPLDFCKSIPALPDPCVRLSALRAHLDHVTLPAGGIVLGGGQLTLDGKRGSLAVSGSVVARGRIHLAAVVPGLGAERGEAMLSEDGLELQGSVHNRSITLRKDACGNRPPTVRLTTPSGPTYPLGQSVMLVGEITDDADTVFPPERVAFVSDRQGPLAGWRPAYRTLITSSLLPGPHRITLRVTDSGGLTGEGELSITVTNRPPVAPAILLRAEGASLAAAASVLLRAPPRTPTPVSSPTSRSPGRSSSRREARRRRSGRASGDVVRRPGRPGADPAHRHRQRGGQGGASRSPWRIHGCRRCAEGGPTPATH